LLSKYRK